MPALLREREGIALRVLQSEVGRDLSGRGRDLRLGIRLVQPNITSGDERDQKQRSGEGKTFHKLLENSIRLRVETLLQWEGLCFG